MVALVLVLAACTPGGEDTTTTAIVSTSSTTTLPHATTTTLPPDGFGGKAIVGIQFDVETLNPPQAGGIGGASLVGNAP